MTQLEAIQRVKESNGRDSHLLPRVIDRGLTLYGCTSLVSLPEGLTVNGHLNLWGCTSLISLPKDLILNGYVDLRYCTSLVSLPEGLTVHGDLYLYGCTSLRSIANARAKRIFLQGDHNIPDVAIAMARFSGIEVIIQ